MTRPLLTVNDLLAAETITGEDVTRLVEEVLGGATGRAPLAAGYVVDLGAAMKANRQATALLRDKTSMAGARRTAARAAITYARAERP